MGQNRKRKPGVVSRNNNEVMAELRSTFDEKQKACRLHVGEAGFDTGRLVAQALDAAGSDVKGLTRRDLGNIQRLQTGDLPLKGSKAPFMIGGGQGVVNRVFEVVNRLCPGLLDKDQRRRDTNPHARGILYYRGMLEMDDHDLHESHHDWMRRFALTILLSLAFGDADGDWIFTNVEDGTKRTIAVGHDGDKQSSVKVLVITGISNPNEKHEYQHKKGIRGAVQITIRTTREVKDHEAQEIANGMP